MGIGLSQLAVKGETLAEVAAAIGLRETGVDAEPFQAPVVGACLPTGWCLFLMNRCDHKLISDSMAQRLSVRFELVTLSLEEHVMFSAAIGWKEGRKIWSVTHKGEKGARDLKTEGALPLDFEKIRGEFFREQDAVDQSKEIVDCIFDIPAALVSSMTGFRYDESESNVSQYSFKELQPAGSGDSWFSKFVRSFRA
ncbi:MAG: hypothetical protein SFY81_05645 [Verrucomicrobiota bacterium]|nr:hypothetical protein [Verrucomicrobiota bacterium]